MSDTTHQCRCGRPTRDSAFVCDDCAAALTKALAEAPAAEQELETTLTRAKGVDYRTRGGTPATERPSPVAWHASDARSNLQAVLVLWTRYCHDENVRHQSPLPGLPADTIPAMARWLLWRVDGLALSDIGPDAVDEITDAVNKAHRLTDTPAPKQFLGHCDVCKDGKLYATHGSRWARCAACDAATDAEEIRRKLLESLGDRLCTAAEIAHLSTYLGLRANRDQVRNRINQWHSRKVISPESSISDEVTFRFGDVYAKLVTDEARTKATA